MGKHILWMIIGCTLPLLLIFLAPALGLSGDVSLLVFVIAMFACHLLMPMHLGGHGHTHGHEEHLKTLKSKEYEPH
ncbi:hypothetical protein [Pontibacter actiniarum]|uniref:DUF2933 domain-containing protein n=1 Tax=Pontibacter actiniarum TaxID=323450 RepID=A0A1X9YZ19_9BACT|nr:hypothetical protein [Pontibacter actiniarum]ARS37994.1 hypothetical protein CA264_20800 [Pontibacter actiniarum]